MSENTEAQEVALEQPVTEEQSVQDKIAAIERDQAKELEDFINDPENKGRAVSLANQVLEVAGKNWFTIRHLQAKTKMTKESTIMKLQHLKLFGLVEMKWVIMAKERIPQFKVTLTAEAKVIAINESIAWHEAAIKQLQEDRKKYEV